MTLNKQSTNFRVLDAAEPFDVCVIGSGFAGTAIGKSLVERGVRTVIVESGRSLPRWLFDTRIRALAMYQTSGESNYPLTRTHARAIGGTSNFWTGRAERLHPLDFEKNAYTPQGASWPISYAEIEPYYEYAEKILRVRGGSLSHYHAPRRTDLPLPPGTDVSSLKAILAEVGVIVDDSPTATPREISSRSAITAAATTLLPVPGGGTGPPPDETGSRTWPGLNAAPPTPPTHRPQTDPKPPTSPTRTSAASQPPQRDTTTLA